MKTNAIKRIAVGALCACVVGAAGIASAADWHGGHGFRGGYYHGGGGYVHGGGGIGFGLGVTIGAPVVPAYVGPAYYGPGYYAPPAYYGGPSVGLGIVIGGGGGYIHGGHWGGRHWR